MSDMPSWFPDDTGSGGIGVLERELDLNESNTSGSGEWTVIVFDNPHNTIEEVILILMEATACTLEEAEIETWEIHHLGKSYVHFSSESDCNRVAQIIRTIGIVVEVRKESEVPT